MTQSDAQIIVIGVQVTRYTYLWPDQAMYKIYPQGKYLMRLRLAVKIVKPRAGGLCRETEAEVQPHYAEQRQGYILI